MTVGNDLRELSELPKRAGHNPSLEKGAHDGDTVRGLSRPCVGHGFLWPAGDLGLVGSSEPGEEEHNTIESVKRSRGYSSPTGNALVRVIDPRCARPLGWHGFEGRRSDLEREAV